MNKSKIYINKTPVYLDNKFNYYDYRFDEEKCEFCCDDFRRFFEWEAGINNEKPTVQFYDYDECGEAYRKDYVEIKNCICCGKPVEVIIEEGKPKYIKSSVSIKSYKLVPADDEK